MAFDSDVALIGTGVAPLVAARMLLDQGKSVLVLNPDRDFFLEDSELPLDPLLGLVGPTRPREIRANAPGLVEADLRPAFPGAVESWAPDEDVRGSQGFHDPQAPHIRSRNRLWVSRASQDLDPLYVECADAELNPQILEGLQAARRFPGHSAAVSGSDEGLYGVMIPRVCDVDVSRYRYGLLEFVRERLGPERLVCQASQVELMPEGVRFHAGGSPRTARIREGILAYWTPRLTTWLLAQAKRSEVAPLRPRGVRIWEQWALNSRDPVDPSIVGVFGNMAVWSEMEGAPSPTPSLTVLRAGGLLELDTIHMPAAGMGWASRESFAALSDLCTGLLNWDRYSVRSMHPRAILEWERAETWPLSQAELPVRVIPRSDGPLVQVVRAAMASVEQLP